MTTYTSTVRNYTPVPASCVLVQKSVQIGRSAPYDVGSAHEFTTPDEARAWVQSQGNAGPFGQPRRTSPSPLRTLDEVWSHAHYSGNACIGTVSYRVIG